VCVRSAGRAALAGLVSFCFSGLALSKDADSDDAAASTPPNIYLDLRTNYATVPANTLSIGFSNPSLSSALATLQSLNSLTGVPTLPALPSLSSPSSRSIGVDVPLTVDVSDRVSLYAGFSASASQSGTSDWSTFTVSSWNVGFQADVYQQNGGSIPTITLQSTFTRSVPDAPLATTSLNTILEFANISIRSDCRSHPDFSTQISLRSLRMAASLWSNTRVNTLQVPAMTIPTRSVS
jgi:hypothetical protein